MKLKKESTYKIIDADTISDLEDQINDLIQESVGEVKLLGSPQFASGDATEMPYWVQACVIENYKNNE